MWRYDPECHPNVTINKWDYLGMTSILPPMLIVPNPNERDTGVSRCGLYGRTFDLPYIEQISLGGRILDHAWIEMDDGWSRGRYAGGVQEEDKSTTTNPKKQCTQIRLNFCVYDIDEFRRWLKLIADRDQLNPKRLGEFHDLTNNCWTWREAAIEEAKRKSKNRGKLRG